MDQQRSYHSPSRAEAAERTRSRIVEAALQLFVTDAYEDVTLRRVAVTADVSLQTVVNHFGSKEGLFAESAARYASADSDRRAASTPDDVDGAMRLLARDYSDHAEANWRLLVLADRIPVVAEALDVGRRQHGEWVRSTFPGAYDGLVGRARERRIRLLMLATDALTWKTLRRDHGLSEAETLATMRDAVRALYGPESPGAKERS